MTQTPVKKIGRFEVLGRLGQGSQGVVVLARDPEIDRHVAIKVLTGKLAAPRDGDAPLEAKISGKLQHPNIVTLHEVGRLRTGRYLVFEYVSGRSLRTIISEEAPLEPGRALALARGIADGLAHAHERGIAHLDLSPGNVLVTEADTARVMDFGLARFALESSDSTSVPVGTIRYMGPEHFSGPRPGYPADVFALGLVLYEMLTGHPAWQEKTATRVMRQLLDEPVNLSALPDAPLCRAIRPVIDQATQKSPTARYANAREMLDAMDTAASANRPREGDSPHATVEFLLRRMRLRSDFPALSRSFAEINRLTGEDSNASLAELSSVVLHDYALANKLLKLANSAFYGPVAGTVSSISQAIKMLGFDRVRIAANGLLFLSSLRGEGRSAPIDDALLRAFASGLITRHFARRLSLQEPEAAFLCGLFQNVGETLAIYYFPEEYEAIRELQSTGTARTVAARAVLGITYETLGRAVGEVWQFPAPILDAITGSDPDEGPVSDAVYGAVFATELCALIAEERLEELPSLVACFEETFPIEEDEVARMLGAMSEKLAEYSTILGVPLESTAFGNALANLPGVHDEARVA